jgi:hypothetical protein
LFWQLQFWNFLLGEILEGKKEEEGKKKKEVDTQEEL